MLLLLSLALAGCTPRSPAVPPPQPMVAVRSSPPVDGGLFLQGFDVTWKARPHRLSRMEIAARGSLEAEDDPLAGILAAEVRGGTWASGQLATDTPIVTVRYGALLSPEVVFRPGSTDLVLRGRVGRRGEPDVPAEASVEVTVELPPDAPRDAVAVWLTGFELDTAPSHPNGYTPHAIAVRASEPILEGDTARFTVTARLEAAPVIDRTQHLAEYGSRVRVDYAVVTAAGADTRFAIRSSVDQGKASVTRHVDPARVPITAQGEAGWPNGVAGLSGFDLDVLVDGAHDGRYVRSLTVGLEDGRYDGARGTYDALVALRFDNTGKLPRKMKVEAEAEFTLLQLPEDAEIRTGRWSPPADGLAHVVSYPDLSPMDGKVADGSVP